MRYLSSEETRAVSGGASKNAGGGPGNSAPGDKNRPNARGQGGLPPSCTDKNALHRDPRGTGAARPPPSRWERDSHE